MTSASHQDPVRARVATNVRMYRQARRLTLEELAERCDSAAGLSISAAALLRIEQGKRGVEAGDLVALALTLRVGVPDLLGPTFDESAGDLAVGAARAMPRAEYVSLISATEHLASAAGRPAEEAVLVPAAQMQAIASAFAAVGAAAGEAARQFSLVTGAGTGPQALAVAAGEHARPFGQPSARLREAGYTTEQLRDRFGPHTPLRAPVDAPVPVPGPTPSGD